MNTKGTEGPWRTLGVLLGAALLVAATQAEPPKEPAAPAKGPDAAAAERGKVIYVRYCAACHGASAVGDGPLARDLRVPPADLTLLSATKRGVFPFDDVARSIDGRTTTRGHGTPDMPAWGEIFQKTKGKESPDSETAIARIAHYVWTLQKPARK